MPNSGQSHFFLIFIFTLFYFTILYWFCHTLTWIHHGCTCIPKHESPSHFPSLVRVKKEPERFHQSGTTEKAEESEASGRGSGDWAVPKAGLGDRNHSNFPHVSQYWMWAVTGRGHDLEWVDPFQVRQSWGGWYIVPDIQSGHLYPESTYILRSEVAQSCPTLCDPVDYSPPGFSVHRILQARILEWVAISFSRGSSQPRDRTQVSCFAGRRFIL